MDVHERGRVLSRNFTSWLLTFGELVKQSEAFQILSVNEVNCLMLAELNGEKIFFSLVPEENKLTWMSEQGTLNLHDVAHNGWTYFDGSFPSEGDPYEGISSPKIDQGSEYVQIHVGRYPDKGDMFVIQTSEKK